MSWIHMARREVAAIRLFSFLEGVAVGIETQNHGRHGVGLCRLILC